MNASPLYDLQVMGMSRFWSFVLPQRYAAHYPQRVASLALTQGFCDTTLFGTNSPSYINM